MAGVSRSAEITVVLVHGAFVDGSSWESVYKILKKDGYNVAIVQNQHYRWPRMSPQPNALFTRRTAR